MQTQCPNCETRFRVTDAQLEAADGQVRCSRCDEIFTAVIIDEDFNDSETDQNIELPEINADLEQSADNKTLDIEEQSADNVIELDPDNKDSYADVELDSGEEIIKEESNDENLENSSINDASELYDDEFEIDLNEQDNTTHHDKSIEDNSEFENDVPENDQKQHLDLFEDDNNQDSPQIIPDEIRHNTASNDSSLGENLAWASGVLLLSSILLAQYFWFSRDQFTASPNFQALIQKACTNFDCSKISIRDPANIELLTRNVYSHPDEKNALMIDVALQNNAKFSQPYPVLQINFSDLRGNAVVARRFTSAEYLPDNNQQEKYLLEPGSSTNFNIEIEDPGKQAITYEFTFL